MPKILSLFSSWEVLGSDPRELFTFSRDQTVWRLTSNSADVSIAAWNDTTFTPAIIGRAKIQRSDESGATRVSVKLGRTVPLVDALRDVGTHPMRLAIHKWQPGAEGDEIVPVLLVEGIVNGVVFQQNGWVELELITDEAEFEAPFPGPIIERQCQREFGDAFCGFDLRTVTLDTTVTDVTGDVVTVSNVDLHVDGYYAGGRLRYGRNQLYIASQVGTALTLFERLPAGFLEALEGGPVAVKLVAGCDKYLSSCLRFDNVEHFLGFDLVPSTDPMKTGLGGSNGTLGDGTSVGPDLGLRITPQPIETPTDGSVILRISDPNAVVVSVEGQWNQFGFAASWSAWETLTPDGDGAYTMQHDKGPGGVVAIATRVTYLDETGASKTVTGSWLFSFDSALGLDFQREILVTEFTGSILDTSGTLAANGLRAYYPMTASRELFVTMALGDVVKLFVDATLGPFTITLPAISVDDATSAPIASFAVSGYRIFKVTKDPTPHLRWTVLV